MDINGERKAGLPGESQPSFLSMYEISGHGRITEYPLNRYNADDKQWGQKIRDLALAQKRIKDIMSVPEDERARLITKALTYPSFEIQEAGVEMIASAPEDKRADLIIKALNHPEVQVQAVAAGIIKSAPEDRRAGLRQIVVEKIRDALGNSEVKVHKTAAGMIQFAPMDKRTGLILEVLDDPSFEVQQVGAWMVEYAPEDRRAGLRQIVVEKIRDALNNSDVTVQAIGAEMISTAQMGEHPKLREIVTEKIREALKNPAVEVQKAAVSMIEFASFEEEKRVELISEVLNRPAVEVQKAAAEMIWTAPKDKQAGLFEQALNKLADKLIEPSLYDEGKWDRLSRKPFAKTGSEITLIGGGLKDKVIVRHLDPDAFLSWKSLYENYKLWQRNGFDYVPVEPIVSYRLEKNGQVAVFSGVLDLSMAQWEKMSQQFKRELRETKNEIEAVLAKQNIRHGHSHRGNFCLRFWRDEKGHPDMNRTPHLYLIDFDQAVSP